MTAYHSDGTPAFDFWNPIETTGTPNEGTNEKQYYVKSKDELFIWSTFPSSPACCDNNSMHIIPQKKNNRWTSARLEGKKSVACPDGKMLRLEANLRTPKASADRQSGLWPAFWAMGESYKHDTQWPMCGEWDIMETASGTGKNLGSLHAGEDGQDYKYPVAATDTKQKEFTISDFHTWAIELDRRPSDWRDQTFNCECTIPTAYIITQD